MAINKHDVVVEAGWLARRMSERSTWAGLGVLLATFGVTLAPEVGQYIAMIGMGVGGLLAIVLPTS